jgi:hypothetical protein
VEWYAFDMVVDIVLRQLKEMCIDVVKRKFFEISCEILRETIEPLSKLSKRSIGGTLRRPDKQRLT